MVDLTRLYRFRFPETDRTQKAKIWKVLSQNFFQKFIKPSSTVVDLATGYGDFINHIQAQRRIAIDLNPDTQKFLQPGIEFIQMPASELLSVLQPQSVDIVFTSNFFEHLKTKDDLLYILRQIFSVLRSDGSLIILGPNIRYIYNKYWDFFDHYLPLSHLSMKEALHQAGFTIKRMHAKFLPFSTRSALPQYPFLVNLYLKMPWIWKILGRQFLIIATPDSGGQDAV